MDKMFPIGQAVDHYAVLEISVNSNPADIKNAYRRMAIHHHPDKGGLTGIFQLIQNAYETLGDPIARQKYDWIWRHRRFDKYRTDPKGRERKKHEDRRKRHEQNLMDAAEVEVRHKARGRLDAARMEAETQLEAIQEEARGKMDAVWIEAQAKMDSAWEACSIKPDPDWKEARSGLEAVQTELKDKLTAAWNGTKEKFDAIYSGYKTKRAVTGDIL